MSEQENTNSFWDKAISKLKICKEESDRFFHIGKVKLDKTFLQKDRQQLMLSLGQKAFELTNAKNIKNAELKELCQKINAIDLQINQQEDKLNNITHSRLETNKDPDEDIELISKD